MPEMLPRSAEMSVRSLVQAFGKVTRSAARRCSPVRSTLTAVQEVLIYLNLILDMLQKREPFYAASARVLACAETGVVEQRPPGDKVAGLRSRAR
jgi:hypothetical protein